VCVGPSPARKESGRGQKQKKKRRIGPLGSRKGNKKRPTAALGRPVTEKEGEKGKGR